MWLINTSSFLLGVVEDPEEYTCAILSHTWGDNEVTFHEVADLG
jgi:hypothetical protein